MWPQVLTHVTTGDHQVLTHVTTRWPPGANPCDHQVLTLVRYLPELITQVWELHFGSSRPCQAQNAPWKQSLCDTVHISLAWTNHDTLKTSLSEKSGQVVYFNKDMYIWKYTKHGYHFFIWNKDSGSPDTGVSLVWTLVSAADWIQMKQQMEVQLTLDPWPAGSQTQDYTVSV